jgi:energy-coupling factor transporter ATP-binding protein EcfA2
MKAHNSNGSLWYGEREISLLIKNYAPRVNILMSVSTPLGLTKQLDQIQQNGQHFIPLNINCLSQNFEEGRNNHWAGLYVIKSDHGISVTYLDPMGEKINKQLASEIQNKLGINNIIQPLRGVEIQYVQETSQGLTGNTNDCGPMLVYCVACMANGKSIRQDIKSLGQSISFGKFLRESFDRNDRFELIHQGSSDNSNENKPFILHKTTKEREEKEYRAKNEERPGNELDEIRQKIEEGNNKIVNNSDQVILVIGKTGAGKSTLVNCLTNPENLEVVLHKNPKNEYDDGTLVISIKDNYIGAPEIGHTRNSQTTIPNKGQDNQGTVYWDCPGFDDTSGPKQDIPNAFFLKKIFDTAKKVKLVLVIEYGDLLHSRANHIKKLTDSLGELFNPKELPTILKGLSLVVTKTNYDVNVRNIKSNIYDILDADCFKQESIGRGILQFLYNSGNSIAILNKPKELGPLAKSNNAVLLNDLGKILWAINQAQFISKPQINIVVSPVSKIRIIELKTLVIQEISLQLSSFCKQINSHYEETVLKEFGHNNEANNVTTESQSATSYFGNWFQWRTWNLWQSNIDNTKNTVEVNHDIGHIDALIQSKKSLDSFRNFWGEAGNFESFEEIAAFCEQASNKATGLKIIKDTRFIKEFISKLSINFDTLDFFTQIIDFEKCTSNIERWNGIFHDCTKKLDNAVMYITKLIKAEIDSKIFFVMQDLCAKIGNSCEEVRTTFLKIDNQDKPIPFFKEYKKCVDVLDLTSRAQSDQILETTDQNLIRVLNIGTKHLEIIQYFCSILACDHSKDVEYKALFKGELVNLSKLIKERYEKDARTFKATLGKKINEQWKKVSQDLQEPCNSISLSEAKNLHEEYIKVVRSLNGSSNTGLKQLMGIIESMLNTEQIKSKHKEKYLQDLKQRLNDLIEITVLVPEAELCEAFTNKFSKQVKKTGEEIHDRIKTQQSELDIAEQQRIRTQQQNEAKLKEEEQQSIINETRLAEEFKIRVSEFIKNFKESKEKENNNLNPIILELKKLKQIFSDIKTEPLTNSQKFTLLLTKEFENIDIKKPDFQFLLGLKPALVLDKFPAFETQLSQYIIWYRVLPNIYTKLLFNPELKAKYSKYTTKTIDKAIFKELLHELGITKNVEYDEAKVSHLQSILGKEAKQFTKGELDSTNSKKLLLSGDVIKISEVNKCIEPSTESIHIQCLNICFDKSLIAHSADLSIISYKWDIIENVKIDLSGNPGHTIAKLCNTITRKGKHGADGAAGEPGHNGGHFYGVGVQFDGLAKLIIDSNGGKGGAGQDGGDGEDGDDITADADNYIYKKTVKTDYGLTWCIKRDVITYVNVSEGGNGGKGGLGGIGGYEGQVILPNNTFNLITVINYKGINGQNGKDGKKGKDVEDRFVWDTRDEKKVTNKQKLEKIEKLDGKIDKASSRDEDSKKPAHENPNKPEQPIQKIKVEEFVKNIEIICDKNSNETDICYKVQNTLFENLLAQQQQSIGEDPSIIILTAESEVPLLGQ